MENKRIQENTKNGKAYNHPTDVDWFEIIARLGEMYSFMTYEYCLNTKIRVLYAYWDWYVYLTNEKRVSFSMGMS